MFSCAQMPCRPQKLATAIVRRLYGLLNTLNYVLILAGPIVVALVGFSTFAVMVRTTCKVMWSCSVPHQMPARATDTP